MCRSSLEWILGPSWFPTNESLYILLKRDLVVRSLVYPLSPLRKQTHRHVGHTPSHDQSIPSAPVSSCVAFLHTRVLLSSVRNRGNKVTNKQICYIPAMPATNSSYISTTHAWFALHIFITCITSFPKSLSSPIAPLPKSSLTMH